MPVVDVSRDGSQQGQGNTDMRFCYVPTPLKAAKKAAGLTLPCWAVGRETSLHVPPVPRSQVWGGCNPRTAELPLGCS